MSPGARAPTCGRNSRKPKAAPLEDLEDPIDASSCEAERPKQVKSVPVGGDSSERGTTVVRCTASRYQASLSCATYRLLWDNGNDTWECERNILDTALIRGWEVRPGDQGRWEQ